MRSDQCIGFTARARELLDELRKKNLITVKVHETVTYPCGKTKERE